MLDFIGVRCYKEFTKIKCFYLKPDRSEDRLIARTFLSEITLDLQTLRTG